MDNRVCEKIEVSITIERGVLKLVLFAVAFGMVMGIAIMEAMK